MGLDIYKLKVKNYDEDWSFFTFLPEYETNKSMINLFKKFEAHTKMEWVDVCDGDVWGDFILSLEIKEDISSISSDGNIYEFRTEDSGGNKTIREFPASMYEEFYDKYPKKKTKQYVLCYKQQEYQRKGMIPAFYDEFLSGVWYASSEKGNKEDSIEFIFDNETLERFKKYLDPEKAPHESAGWSLAEDEFIWLWA
jgi:hypothetical protein